MLSTAILDTRHGKSYSSDSQIVDDPNMCWLDYSLDPEAHPTVDEEMAYCWR